MTAACTRPSWPNFSRARSSTSAATSSSLSTAAIRAASLPITRRLKPTSRVQRARWSLSGPPACRCRRAAPQALAAERPSAEPSFTEKLGNFFRSGSTKPDPAPVQAAAAAPQPPAPKRESIKSRVSKMVGLRGSSTPQTTAEAPAPNQAATARSSAPKVKTAEAPVAPPAPAPSQSGGMMSGAQPAPSSSNFDSRWSAFR